MSLYYRNKLEKVFFITLVLEHHWRSTYLQYPEFVHSIYNDKVPTTIYYPDTPTGYNWTLVNL